MKQLQWIACLVLMVPAIASAHPGHGADIGFWAGWMHPFSGLDHMLVMLALGVWASKLGGASRWQLPVTFVSVMALGMVLASRIGPMPWMETALAATLMAMGLLLILTRAWSMAFQLGATFLFALSHGVAHGHELTVSVWSALGVLLATALLHILGLSLPKLHAASAPWVQRALASVMMVLGLYTLLTL